MATKTNYSANGKEYFRITRKVGMKLNSEGQWVENRKQFYGKSKKEAEEKYNQYLMKQSLTSVNNKCLGELIDQWIENTLKHSELKESTQKNYINAYKAHFRDSFLAGTSLSSIEPLDIQKFLNESDIAYGTLESIYNLLVRFFKYIELAGMGRNIMGSITLPKKKKTHEEDFKGVDVWDNDELKRVIEALEGHRLRLLVVLAANTGARISELLALTYSDIKGNMLYITKQLKDESSKPDDEGMYTTTKTNSSNRVIPLSKAVLKEISIHRAMHNREMMENNYRTNSIFTTSTGNHYYRKNISLALSRLYKRIGVTHHVFHSFRHTFATNLSKAGVPIEETSKLLGHSSIAVTSKYYIDVDAQRKLDAVEKIVACSL